MPAHRISLLAEPYGRLAYLAALSDLKPNELVTMWIQAAWDHREEKAKKPSIQATAARPKGTFSDSEIDQIKQLTKDGIGPTEIARRLNRHKSSISYAIGAMKRRGEL